MMFVCICHNTEDTCRSGQDWLNINISTNKFYTKLFTHFCHLILDVKLLPTKGLWRSESGRGGVLPLICLLIISIIIIDILSPARPTCLTRTDDEYSPPSCCWCLFSLIDLMQCNWRPEMFYWSYTTFDWSKKASPTLHSLDIFLQLLPLVRV